MELNGGSSNQSKVSQNNSKNTTSYTNKFYGTQATFRQHVSSHATLTLNLPTTTIVAQPFNIIKWQLKFNPVA